ncbi:hypothetical protein chiPu_0027360, partial [Chiloscyllium punctatum]|nr:hypothetical protein [Chiloscyllium punctatum]
MKCLADLAPRCRFFQPPQNPAVSGCEALNKGAVRTPVMTEARLPSASLRLPVSHGSGAHATARHEGRK